MLLHSQYSINLNIYCKCGTATNVLTILAEAKKNIVVSGNPIDPKILAQP